MSSNQDWPWWKVKAEIERRGGSLTKIATAAAVTQPTLSLVKSYPSPAAQKAIADFIGVPATVIWPTRYTAQGVPVNATAWRRKFANEQRVA